MWKFVDDPKEAGGLTKKNFGDKLRKNKNILLKKILRIQSYSLFNENH